MTSPPSPPSARRPHRDTAQNFYKCQNNFAQGLTLDQYLCKSSAFNTSSTNFKKTRRRNKFQESTRPLDCINVRITEKTEKTEASLDNSDEKRYLDASFEINETDEDGYVSNSSMDAREKEVKEKEVREKDKQSTRKVKDKLKAFGHNSSLVNHQNLNKEQINGRDQHNLSKENRENSYFHPTMSRETFYQASANREARENSHNSKDNRENTFYGHMTMGKSDNTKAGKARKKKENMHDVCNNGNEQKENIQKISNQSNRTHHSQSPVQNSSKLDFSIRRNCSKDANESFWRKERNDIMRNTFKNSNNNNNNNELLNTNYSIFVKKGYETGSKFYQSNYLQKSKGTMSEIYKNQGKYSDNLPIGPPKR